MLLRPTRLGPSAKLDISYNASRPTEGENSYQRSKNATYRKTEQNTRLQCHTLHNRMEGLNVFNKP